MAHVVLAFPDGRLEWLSRALVAGAYAECLVDTAVRRPWLTEAEPGGWFTSLVEDTQPAVTVALGAGVLLVQVRKWWHSSPIDRRALTYVLVTSAVAIVLYEIWQPLRDSGMTVWSLDFGLRIGIAAVPLAYLGTLARRKIDQTGAENARLAMERVRLERDLHDGMQQRLLSIAVTLGLAESTPDRSRPLVAEAKTAVLAALAEVRAVCNGIHPPILTERGLKGAVQEMTMVAPVPTKLSLDLPDFVPPAVETVTYYMIAEALANIGKHADARQAQIDIHRAGRTLIVEVRDDGRGGATPTGSGLKGLTERIESNGGTMAIVSNPGEGTTLKAVLPCE